MPSILYAIIPAQAGIQPIKKCIFLNKPLDSRLRGNDVGVNKGLK
jgi:hypothetical protein